MEEYRYKVFRGEINPNRYNCEFWKSREKLCGDQPPVQRSEQDFDLPAIYHVSADNQYISYLFANVLQFQFHKSACLLAGEYEPGNKDKLLADCDIYQSTVAGNAFK